MTYSEISNLLDKGFTPDQIMTLSGGMTTPAREETKPEETKPEDGGKQVENTETPEENKENKETHPADNPQPVAAEVEKVIKELKDLRDQMEKMKGEFQKNAILTDSIKTPTQVSADEALSELIRPKYNESK